MYRVYLNQAASVCVFISVFFLLFFSLQFSNIKFFCHIFLRNCEAYKVETWYSCGQMYHVYWNQAVAVYLSIYFFIFLSLQFSNIRILVTLFSGTVRPKGLKLGLHMDSRQMYHVYQNQAVAVYLSLYFFIFLSLQFSNISSLFFQELWGLEGWNLIQMWTVGRCIVYTGIRLLLLIHPFISSFFFPIFKH